MPFRRPVPMPLPAMLAPDEPVKLLELYVGVSCRYKIAIEAEPRTAL
jgi:hypothetical protein